MNNMKTPPEKFVILANSICVDQGASFIPDHAIEVVRTDVYVSHMRELIDILKREICDCDYPYYEYNEERCKNVATLNHFDYEEIIHTCDNPQHVARQKEETGSEYEPKEIEYRVRAKKIIEEFEREYPAPKTASEHVDDILKMGE